MRSCEDRGLPKASAGCGLGALSGIQGRKLGAETLTPPPPATNTLPRTLQHNAIIEVIKRLQLA